MLKKRKTQQLGVRVPADLIRRLDQHLKGVRFASRAHLVEYALEEFLKNDAAAGLAFQKLAPKK